MLNVNFVTTLCLVKLSGDTSALEDFNMMQLRDHIVAREVSIALWRLAIWYQMFVVS